MDSQQSLQLKDIHLPPNPDIWPLAIGWWILLAVLIAIAVWLGFVLRKYLRIKKEKKQLFAELEQLENKLNQSPDKNSVAETNILLRRLALAYYPNVEVASLTGNAWLDFLDKSGNTNKFSNGAGRVLAEAPYRAGQLENYKADEFIPLIRTWVGKTAQKVGGCH